MTTPTQIDRRLTPEAWQALETWAQSHEPNWLQDLLMLWSPSGTDDPKHPLRLAVRNNYLNFYFKGQCVALVSFPHGKPKLEVHVKYAFEKGTGQDHAILREKTVEYSDQSYAYLGPATLQEWVDRARGKVGKEKSFVDAISARNPNVIDLEIALPSDRTPGEMSARRMDIVALEPVGNGWRLVFWEAKLVTNGEARAEGDSIPKVIGQLREYENWLSKYERASDIVDAYQRCCALLVNIHALSQALRPDIGVLGKGITDVSAMNTCELILDCSPRLLIRDTESNLAFVDNGHFQKLEAANIFVQMVQDKDQFVLRSRA